MNVAMEDGLPGGGSGVHPDVKALDRRILGDEFGALLVQHPTDRVSFRLKKPEVVDDVPL